MKTINSYESCSDLPPLEPASPPRPLTLCPETGKVLLKAEGEKTPEPTPPHSPKQNSHETSAPSMVSNRFLYFKTGIEFYNLMSAKNFLIS